MFDKMARLYISPFRLEALDVIYQTALTALNWNIRSANVLAWSNPGEEGAVLILVIATQAQGRELDEARRVILEQIATAAATWTDEQRKDYSKTIYFELEHIDV